MALPVVLMVEDEPLVSAVAADWFSERGLEVLEAENLVKALAFPNRRSDVRLVFTDINMLGRIDGLALAREVHRRWPEMILMLPSGRERPSKDVMPNDGEFILKPYDFESLADRIQKLLTQ